VKNEKSFPQTGKLKKFEVDFGQQKECTAECTGKIWRGIFQRILENGIIDD